MGVGPSSWAPGSVGITYCHRSHLGRPMCPLMSRKLCDQQEGRMALLARSHWGATGAPPKNDSLPAVLWKPEVWPVPHLSNLATKTSFKTNMISKATTTQLWMDSRLPLNTCYWWVTQNLGKISCNSWHPREAATGNKTCIVNLNSVDLLCLCSHSSATPVMLYSSAKEACDLICYPIELRFLSPLLIPQCCSVKITQKNFSYRRYGDWG